MPSFGGVALPKVQVESLWSSRPTIERCRRVPQLWRGRQATQASARRRPERSRAELVPTNVAIRGSFWDRRIVVTAH